jgi:serine/threonine-protein kinase RsbW
MKRLVTLRGGAALDELLEILRSSGLHAERASSFEALEDGCRFRPPAAVLLDYEAADVDALDITRRWKLDRPLYYPSLIFVTGRRDAKPVIDGLRTGANLVLARPFARERLVPLLHEEMHRFDTASLPVEHAFTITEKPDYLCAVNRFLDLVLHCTEARPDTLEDLRLCMGELGMNAIVHGNKGDPAKQVQVSYLIDAKRVEVSIADEGAGFRADELPDPTSPDRLLLPSGRGIFLVRQFTDELSFNEHGNEVRFVKRLG